MKTKMRRMVSRKNISFASVRIFRFATSESERDDGPRVARLQELLLGSQ